MIKITLEEILKTKDLLNCYLGKAKTESINRDICKIIEENNLQYNPRLLEEIFKYAIISTSLQNHHM